jgi:recombination protein RecA
MQIASEVDNIEWLPTGLQGLDKILGGGIPFKKITEISGQYSVGKSTLALMIIAEAQKQKKTTLLADIEYAYEPIYSSQMGVDGKKLLIIRNQLAEDSIDELEEFAAKNKNAVIVLDAIGALSTRDEAEKTSDGKTIGGQAKLVAKFCRKIVPLLDMNNIALIVLNHSFTDIMTGRLKTSGGAKLEYHKSLQLSLRKANKRIMQGERQIGDIIEVEIRKNKLASTLHQKCELELFYGQGFSKQADLLQEALDKGIITKQGNSYFFASEKLCTGLPKLRELFKDESFADKIKACL